MESENEAAQHQSTRVHLPTPVRISLALASIAFFILSAIAMLFNELDGIAVAVALAATVVLSVGALVGVLPARMWLKDSGVDWGMEEILSEAVDLADASAASPAASKHNDDDDELDFASPLFLDASRRHKLFEISPTAAVVAQFSEVEEQLMGLARDLGEDAPYRSKGLRPSLREVARRLEKADVISKWHLDMIVELARVRNTAAHAPSDLLSGRATRDLFKLLEVAAEVAMDLNGRRKRGN